MTVLTLFGSVQIVGLLVQSIKRDLSLTDTQVSLIVGFAAAAFNALASLPISRLVDRLNRRMIMGVGLLIVGAGSIFTAIAHGFWQLFAARLFAGVGGAGNGPAAYSLLADYFPPAKLPRAIAFINFGFTSGNGLALLLGGALIGALAKMGNPVLPVFGELHAWQLVFLVLAIPDLVLGVLLLTTMHEPVRRGRALDSRRAAPVGTVLRHLWTHRGAFGPMFGGLALNSLALGTLAWLAPFTNAPTAGARPNTALSLALLPADRAAGLTFGGWLAERWAKQGRDDANLRVVAVAALCTCRSRFSIR